MSDRRDFLRFTAGAAAAVAVGVPASTPRAAPRGRRSGPDWAQLRRHLSGRLVLPSDPGYAQAGQGAIGQYDSVTPQAVVYCATERDVRTVIGFTADNSLHTVPRSGGHSLGGYSATTGVVLDVSRLNRVHVESPARVVVGAGTQQVDALNALSPHGLTLPGGTCPNVAVGGFIQGGGIGLQTRKYGMACDRLLAATVVLADGRIVRASQHEHPDLFWALRGNGGGNYGVVTSFELVPTRVPAMANYTLNWSWDAAGKVVRAWQRWAAEAPGELGASLGVLNADPVSGSPVVSVYGAWLGGRDALDPRLDALVARVGVAPASRDVAEKSYFDAMMQWYGCQDLPVDQCHRIGYSPEARMPRLNFYLTRNRMYAGPLPDGQVDDLLAAYVAAPRRGQYRLFYVESVGGAANRPGRSDTAYVHRDAELVAGYTIALTDVNYTSEDVTAAQGWLATGFGALDQNSLGESYQNFIDPALTDWRRAYYAENYRRLVAVKREYDPHGFFHFARGIG